MASHELLQGLIEATLAGSAAILLVLIMRRPFRRGFGARAAYALWLLVPLAILATLLPAAGVAVGPIPMAQRLVLPPVFAAPVAPVQDAIDGSGLLLGLWLLGAAVSAVLLWRAQIAFRRGLGHLLPHGDALRAQAATAGLPATLGLWHPQVVLPADFESRFDAVQQTLVLAHERRHVVRGDAWANAAAALLRCLFWFDPLFHLAGARMRHDQELACDADVLAAHPQQRRPYGAALLNTQLALQTAPLGCHFGFGHPLKERIAMLATSVSTTRRRLGSCFLLCTLLGGGYAAWAAQPAVPVAVVPADGIAVDIVLQVDEGARRTLRIVSEADKPFSLETEADGRRLVIAGSVSRVEHRGEPALSLSLRIDENGNRIAEPKLVVANGKPAAIRLGSETPTRNGGKVFKGLQLGITVSDAAAGGVTLQRNQANMREVMMALARERGLTVSGLELIPAKQTVSMGLKDVPLETLLVLIGESTGLDARLTGKRIEFSKKIEPVETASRLQQGQVLNESRSLHPPRYPADAQKEGKAGVTVLVVDIDAQGIVTGMKVEHSSGDTRFDAAALEAAAKWRFNPALKQGRPVASKVRVPIEFALDEPAGATPTGIASAGG